MPLFPKINPVIFPVSTGGTKRIRYPTFCNPNDVAGAPAAATSHTTGAMSLIPYYIPSNVSSIDIALQYVNVPGSTGGTIQVGIYSSNTGLENAYLTESTSFACTASTTSGTVNVIPLTGKYEEGWYIVSAVKTSGSSQHANGFIRQGHIFGKPPSYPASPSIDMFFNSTTSVYITNQTSGLSQTISSAMSIGTYLATSAAVPAPLPFLAY